MKAGNFSHKTLQAIEAAKASGEILRKGFYQARQIQYKEGDHKIVTQFDLESENLIKGILKEDGVGFLCEESGFTPSKNRSLWIVDPLDGTVNFAHSIPFFSVSIALIEKESLQLGIVFNPMTNELFVAEKGKGAFLNGEKITVSSTKALKGALLATGFPYNVKENPLSCIEQFTKFVKMGLPIRRLGSAALDLAYVACGRFDAFFEVSLEPWDFSAGALIIEEAGGKVSTYNSQPLDFLNRSTILGSNGIIHHELTQQLTTT